MTADPTTYDAIVVGSGISGGWAAKELTEKGLRRPAARARPQRRAHQGLRQRHEGAVGIPASRRPHRRDGRGLPGAQARLSAQREESRLLGQREGFALHRGQALRLVSRLSGRRPLAHVGTPELPLERFRLRGATRRTASPSTGRSATPTSRRGTTTSRSTRASPARTKDWRSFPTDSSSRRCRSTAARSSSPDELKKRFDGKRRIIPGRVANATQALQGRSACQYRNACWLGCPYGALLQHAVVDAAGRGEDRQAHAQAVRRS